MMYPTPIVLLANGAFPTHPFPLRLLHEAKTLICTDGSYQSLCKIGLKPTLIIGDMDSIDKTLAVEPGQLLYVDNQNNSDTAKALDWCIMQNIPAITLLGSTGLREDHHLANLFLMKQYADRLSITMVTDHCLIRCLTGTHELESYPNQIISLIAFDQSTRVATQGLQYPLCNEPLLDASHGMSNVALANTFRIACDHPIFLFQQLQEPEIA